MPIAGTPGSSLAGSAGLGPAAKTDGRAHATIRAAKPSAELTTSDVPRARRACPVQPGRSLALPLNVAPGAVSAAAVYAPHMTSFRRASSALLLTWLVVGSVPAQSTPPGLCFALNDVTGVSVANLPLVAGGEVYLAFTAPVGGVIERVDIGMSFPASPTYTLDVFQAPGGSLGPLIATATGTWLGLAIFNLTSPVTFAAGQQYALRLTTPAGSPVSYIQGPAVPPTPLSYALSCGASPPVMFPPCSTYATLGTFGATIRFRAVACGQSPLATAIQVGTPCGGGSFGPSMSLTTPPVLGTTTAIAIYGASGINMVFGAGGPATGGVPLGGGCNLYLDPISLQTLAAAGLEPLVAAPTSGFPTYISIAIPATPALAGSIFTLQTAILGVATGVVIAGYTTQMSNAVQVTLGY